MQIAIVNILTQAIIEKVDAENEQQAVEKYAAILAEEYGYDTPKEFCFQNPLIVNSLHAIMIH